jgi:hypothetical protein
MAKGTCSGKKYEREWRKEQREHNLGPKLSKRIACDHLKGKK